MGRVRRSWVATLMVAVVAPLALAACSGDDGGSGGDQPKPADSVAAPASAPAAPAPEAFSLAVTPAADAKNLPVSTEIGTKVTGGQVTAVTLREEGGGAVKGRMRDDGSAWVPDRPLKHATAYEAKVTATSAAGQPTTKSTTFRTMGTPGARTGTGLYLFDGNTYGVAMPVVVEFHPGIAKKDRARVQKRMFVTTNPPQPGTWHWVKNGSQAFYRAPKYWKPGTTLTVRIGVEGHPTGGGRYGDVDRRATAKIGRSFEMKVDNATKQMSVYDGGKLVKKMPVSLGKKSTPSSSGTMVVMEKKESTVFDTFAELGPAEGYRTNIDFAQRLTWGGEFIHSAPWSVGQQGRTNVSHGCVNLSPANARWLFAKSMVGDPVTVVGTEQKLEHGNGWTPWDLTWEQFVKGSALPVPDDLRSAGG